MVDKKNNEMSTVSEVLEIPRKESDDDEEEGAVTIEDSYDYFDTSEESFDYEEEYEYDHEEDNADEEEDLSEYDVKFAIERLNIGFIPSLHSPTYFVHQLQRSPVPFLTGQEFTGNEVIGASLISLGVVPLLKFQLDEFLLVRIGDFQMKVSWEHVVFEFFHKNVGVSMAFVLYKLLKYAYLRDNGSTVHIEHDCVGDVNQVFNKMQNRDVNTHFNGIGVTELNREIAPCFAKIHNEFEFLVCDCIDFLQSQHVGILLCDTKKVKCANSKAIAHVVHTSEMYLQVVAINTRTDWEILDYKELIKLGFVNVDSSVSYVLLSELGWRYNRNGSGVARILLIDLNARQIKAFTEFWKANEAVIGALRPGNKLSWKAVKDIVYLFNVDIDKSVVVSYLCWSILRFYFDWFVILECKIEGNAKGMITFVALMRFCIWLKSIKGAIMVLPYMVAIAASIGFIKNLWPSEKKEKYGAEWVVTSCSEPWLLCTRDINSKDLHEGVEELCQKIFFDVDFYDFFIVRMGISFHNLVQLYALSNKSKTPMGISSTPTIFLTLQVYDPGIQASNDWKVLSSYSNNLVLQKKLRLDLETLRTRFFKGDRNVMNWILPNKS